MLRTIAFVLCGVLIGWSLASFPTTVLEDKTTARPLPSSRRSLVLAALEQPCEFDFQNQSLRDVVRILSQKHGIPIQLDHRALGDDAIDGDTPINCALKNVTLRSGLKLLLLELGLTYVTEDGFLLITSQSEAENKLQFRIYPVKDLIATDSEFRSPLRPGGKNGSDFDDLTEVISCVLAPTTWDEVGGPATLSEHPNSEALSVSQTEEVHEEIAELLEALRRVRDKQIAAAHSFGSLWRIEPPDDTDDGELEVRAYQFFRQPPDANASKPAAGDVADSAANSEAAEKLAAARLDAWTKVVAKLVPEMIEPSTWEPKGKGRIRAAGGTIIIRQTADVQYRVGKLMYQLLLPGFNPLWYPQQPFLCNPAVRLVAPPRTAPWPHAAEPLPCGVEARIIAALAEDCDLEFSERPFSEVIAAFSERHKIPMRLDQEALEDDRVDANAPVTRAIRGITLRAALKSLLDELELAYVIRNGALLITSQGAAENMLIAKVYPVFDLVVRRQGASSRAPALDFASLIEAITADLAPTSWDEVGGPAAIREFTNAGAVVISQTTEVHEQITAYLQALRETAAVGK